MGLCLASPIFLDIFLLIYFFWKFGERATAFGRMGIQHPHFLKLARTLGSIKCSIPHGDWKAISMKNGTFLLNLDHT
jgi:hypothetical protein